MIYAWKCRTDQITKDSEIAPVCPLCNHLMRRDWSAVNLHVPVFRPHFNHAVGRQVTTSRDFDEALRLKGEEQNTSYTRLDPGDYESITPSTDTEAIEISRRESRDRGLTRPSTTTIMV